MRPEGERLGVCQSQGNGGTPPSHHGVLECPPKHTRVGEMLFLPHPEGDIISLQGPRTPLSNYTEQTNRTLSTRSMSRPDAARSHARDTECVCLYSCPPVLTGGRQGQSCGYACQDGFTSPHHSSISHKEDQN